MTRENQRYPFQTLLYVGVVIAVVVSHRLPEGWQKPAHWMGIALVCTMAPLTWSRTEQQKRPSGWALVVLMLFMVAAVINSIRAEWNYSKLKSELELEEKARTKK